MNTERQILGYNVTDHQTKAVLKFYPDGKGRVARAYAEKLNLKYGAHRYSAQIVWSDAE